MEKEEITKVHKNKLNFYNKNVGKNMKYYRKLKDISQLNMSAFLGIDKSTISLYENGRINIPVKHAAAIAAILEIGIEKVFEDYKIKFKNLNSRS